MKWVKRLVFWRARWKPWRSSEIITVNYFCVHYKIRRKHSQHFKLLKKINLHFITTNQRSTYRNAKKTHKDQIVLCVFLLSHKLLKVAVVKSFSSGLYFIATACFDEYFLFHVITGRRYFSKKFIVTPTFI